MKISVDLKLAPIQLAEIFCEMSDEEQAQFFIETSRLVKEWNDIARHLQWLEVGKHLRECECSTDEARELVKDIYQGIVGD